jgi:hypothetical protein
LTIEGSSRFYRAAAFCSVASAVTTLCLIYLPLLYPPVNDFEQRMALGSHWAYQWRSWIYLIHPFLVFTAVLAVAMRVRRHAAGAAALGLAGFTLWATTEAAQQALTKVALDRTWRVAWPTAEPAVRELIRQQVGFYDVIWDSMYLLLLLGFAAGNVLLAIAVAGAARVRGTTTLVAPRLAIAVSGAFAAAALLTFLILLPELGGPTVANTGWLYPLIQPAGRALIGVWLWRESSRRLS